MAKYTVTGEYITVLTATSDGVRLVGLYKGAPLPGDVPQESIDHHLSTGQIALVEEVTDDPVAQGADVPPSGSFPNPSAVQTGEPKKSASKAEWVDYAVSKGADRADAESATKDDLVAVWGSK